MMSSHHLQWVREPAEKRERDTKLEFTTLVHQEQAALERYCHMLTGSSFDAEDLVQDTWLKVYSSFSNVEKAMQPRAYIRKIARNQWTDNFRRHENQRPSQLDEMTMVQERDPLEIKAALEDLVHHLPPRQQAAILLTEALQFTAREVADMLDTTEGAVKALLSRARATLRNVREASEEAASEGARGESRDPLEAAAVDAYFDAVERGDAPAIISIADGQMEGIATRPTARLSAGSYCMAA